MDLENLKESFVAVDERIAHVLANRVTRPYASCKNLGRRLSGVLQEYRVRALLHYLIDADIPGFFADLNRNAASYRTLLEAFHAKLDVTDEDVDGSNVSSVACAIAAGNFALCAELDRLMPRTRAKGEDKDAFAFTTMLRTLAARPEDAKAAFEAFEEQCEESPQLQHLVAASQGLLDKDLKRFTTGLARYLDSFADLDFGAREELDPGEDAVSIEGLAYLQLAKRQDLPIKFEHKMTPRVLQSPAKSTPKDGYPAWPG